MVLIQMYHDLWNSRERLVLRPLFRSSFSSIFLLAHHYAVYRLDTVLCDVVVNITQFVITIHRHIHHTCGMRYLLRQQRLPTTRARGLQRERCHDRIDSSLHWHAMCSICTCVNTCHTLQCATLKLHNTLYILYVYINNVYTNILHWARFVRFYRIICRISSSSCSSRLRSHIILKCIGIINLIIRSNTQRTRAYDFVWIGKNHDPLSFTRCACALASYSGHSGPAAEDEDSAGALSICNHAAGVVRKPRNDVILTPSV